MQDNANPEWAPCQISSGKLCNGDWNRKLKFEIFDYDSDGGHDFIGEFETTLEEMSAGKKAIDGKGAAAPAGNPSKSAWGRGK